MQKFSLNVNRWAHYISCLVLIGLMFSTVADVFMRFFFRNPIRGTYELTELSLIFIVFLALGYAQHHEDHVVIDVIYERLPRKVRAYIYLFSSVVYLLLLSLMAWRLYLYIGRMAVGGYMTASLKIPVWPIVIIAVIGVICCMLAVLSNTLSFNKREGESDNDSG